MMPYNETEAQSALKKFFTGNRDAKLHVQRITCQALHIAKNARSVENPTVIFEGIEEVELELTRMGL